MALSNATRLSDFGSGIGTEGAVLKVDNTLDRVGIGTTEPSVTLDVAGIVTARTGFNIGINSVGVAITETVKTLNFVGTGNTFISRSGGTIDISISGGAGGASKIYDSTVFAYDNVIDSDTTIESPYKVATLFTSPDVTCDIEDDVTVTVDSGCTLNFIDI
jgi:hypothetical protein